jgi:hypothetical protein
LFSVSFSLVSFRFPLVFFHFRPLHAFPFHFNSSSLPFQQKQQ